MTGKRFKPKRHCKDGKCHNLILDKSYHKFLLILSSWEDCKDVAEVLNELNDENKHLEECWDLSLGNNTKLVHKVAELSKENEQLKQYKDAVLNCDSSKIIRVNKNTGEVDLIDKEYSDES